MKRWLMLDRLLAVTLTLLLVASAASLQAQEKVDWQENVKRMAEGLGGLVIFALLVLTILGVMAFVTSIAAINPGFVQRQVEVLQGSFRACFWWGLAGVALTVVVMMLLGLAGEIGKGAAFVVLLALTACTLFGLPGVSVFIGQRILQAARGGEPSVPLCALIGSAMISAASLLPCLGWLLFLYMLIISLGAFRLALFRRRQKEQVMPP